MDTTSSIEQTRKTCRAQWVGISSAFSAENSKVSVVSGMPDKVLESRSAPNPPTLGVKVSSLPGQVCNSKLSFRCDCYLSQVRPVKSGARLRRSRPSAVVTSAESHTRTLETPLSRHRSGPDFRSEPQNQAMSPHPCIEFSLRHLVSSGLSPHGHATYAYHGTCWPLKTSLPVNAADKSPSPPVLMQRGGFRRCARPRCLGHHRVT